MRSVFVFSVDVEEPVQEKRALKLLKTCKDYFIPTTFAVVGKLFEKYEGFIKKVKQERFYEVACHSFSHKSYLKLSVKQAEIDIAKSVEIAKKYGINFDSFVFPRNEVCHEKLLLRNGFKNYVFDSKTGRLPIVKPFFDRTTGLTAVPRTMYFNRVSKKDVLKAKIALFKARFFPVIFHLWTHLWNLENESFFLQLEKIFLEVNNSGIQKKTINALGEML